MIRFIAAIAVAASVSACSNGVFQSQAFATGGVMPVTPSGAVVASRDYDVVAVNVTVPEELDVSEGNNYYPFADIVWRGDPIGDRYAQIAAIFEEAASRGVLQSEGARPVIADIEVVRFHGVTERTRYSVGGNYNIVFDLAITDALSGEIVEAERRVAGNLPAPGGEAAVRLEQNGQTEKVRVLDFLTLLLQEEIVAAP